MSTEIGIKRHNTVHIRADITHSGAKDIKASCMDIYKKEYQRWW